MDRGLHFRSHKQTYEKLENSRGSSQRRSTKKSREVREVGRKHENKVPEIFLKDDPEKRSVSATSKALNRMEEEMKRRKFPKTGKITSKFKRQKMNEKLAKILIPKNALILLNELKPGCAYITKETACQRNIGCVGFIVQVKHGKDILGTGQGLSKSQAKNLAAESAIRTIFSQAVKSASEENPVESENEDDASVFPWAGLAQFALYKMFSEWQLQSPDFPSIDIQKLINVARNPKASPSYPPPRKETSSRKEIPPDAHNLHPTAVLNNLHPGLLCIELERTIGPPSRVKMAFELDGKQYCGVSTNKKEAKKEAAKLLLSTLYGVKYKL